MTVGMLTNLMVLAAPVADSNFYAGAKAMIYKLQVSILQSMWKAFPFQTMMNMIWYIIASIFLFHFLEATFHAFRSGTGLGIFNTYKDLIRKKLLRIGVFATLSLGAVILLDGGMTALASGPLGNWADTTFGETISEYLGANSVSIVSVTNPDGTTTDIQTIQYEAPVLQELDKAADVASKTVDGLSASDVFDSVNQQIEKALSAGQSGAAGVGTLGAGIGQLNTGGTVSPAAATSAGLSGATSVFTILVMPLLDGIMYLSNWFTFLWAQWALTRTIIVQTLFLRLGWHLGLYFLPIFLLLAYFKPMQGFLTNLLKNYLAMMVAGYVMAALCMTLFAPGAWIGTKDASGNWSGGLIQTAFSGVSWQDGGKGLEPGTFPWIMKTYARQVARAQIVWLLGACGIILGKAYELTKGVIDGGFRTHFDGGSGESIMGK